MKTFSTQALTLEKERLFVTITQKLEKAYLQYRIELTIENKSKQKQTKLSPVNVYYIPTFISQIVKIMNLVTKIVIITRKLI